MTRTHHVFWLVLMLFVSGSTATVNAQTAAGDESTSCLKCHTTIDDEDLAKPALDWAKDVHAAAGLGCESCHGGDASPMTSEDFAEAAESAMDPANGFLPVPNRLEMAQFCARCHADPVFMKRFNPQARVDQYAEYLTSVHGRLNAAGDETPATCIDCHGVHGIRAVTSPESPAYAANVPKTCAHCHADASLMQPYGIPTDQYDTYMKSEHAHALLVKGDLAAPACNDCHGNHGATPPEVNSVANVCGQCHGREASLFEKSTHKAIFEEIGEPACVTCHDNHLVRHPTPELFMTHSMPEVSSGRVTATNPFSADIGHVSAADTVTAVWRSVLSSHLPADDLRYRHQVEVAAEDMPPILLDATLVPGASIVPEVVRGVSSNGSSASLSIEPLYGLPVEPGDAVLFTLQFHAGANGPVSNVTIRDLPGEAVQSGSGSVCMQCHVPGDSCDTATAELYVSLSHMERRLRAGAAILHRAEIAGMEVSGPQFELKSEGTTAAVESRALIHTFDRVRMLERAADGLAAANAAVKAGEDALAELQVRRKGLAVSLLLIVLVLVGLYLKIRDINRIRREEAVEQ